MLDSTIILCYNKIGSYTFNPINWVVKDLLFQVNLNEYNKSARAFSSLYAVLKKLLSSKISLWSKSFRIRCLYCSHAPLYGISLDKYKVSSLIVLFGLCVYFSIKSPIVSSTESICSSIRRSLKSNCTIYFCKKLWHNKFVC